MEKGDDLGCGFNYFDPRSNPYQLASESLLKEIGVDIKRFLERTEPEGERVSATGYVGFKLPSLADLLPKNSSGPAVIATP